MTSRMISLSIAFCLYSCIARQPCGCRNGCCNSPSGPSIVGRSAASRWRHDRNTSSSQGFLSVIYVGKGLRKRGKRDVVGGMSDGDQLLRERKRPPGRLLVDHLVENAAERPHVAGAANLRSRWPSDRTRMLLRPFVSLTSNRASGEM